MDRLCVNFQKLVGMAEQQLKELEFKFFLLITTSMQKVTVCQIVIHDFSFANSKGQSFSRFYVSVARMPQ